MIKLSKRPDDKPFKAPEASVLSPNNAMSEPRSPGKNANGIRVEKNEIMLMHRNSEHVA